MIGADAAADVLTRAALCGLFLSGLAAVGYAVFEVVREEWRRGGKVARRVFLAATAGAAAYAGAKAGRPTVSYPPTEAGQAYLVDRGSYVTNDFVHVDFTRRIVPDDAALVIERREVASTNAADWAVYLETTFAAFAVPTNLPCANATNWNWAIWADWTPPPSVQTNGVLHADWGRTTRDASLRAAGLAVGVPARSSVALDGARMDVPSCRVYTARDYVQDGLIAMRDGDIEFYDTSYCLKNAGTNAVENPYTAEFVDAKRTNDRWEGVEWNTARYPLLYRENKAFAYTPNADQSGSYSSYPGYGFPLGKVMCFGARSDGVRHDQFVDGELFASTAFVDRLGGSMGVVATSVYPKKLNLLKRTEYPMSYRLYSRALTDEEIAHNYKIDCARFGLGTAAGVSAVSASSLSPETAARAASDALDALTGATIAIDPIATPEERKAAK